MEKVHTIGRRERSGKNYGEANISRQILKERGRKGCSV